MTSPTQSHDVIIAGGSFAGLALALALRQAARGEIDIAIIDRGTPSAVANDSRAFAIWAGAKSVLEALGVWSEIAAEAQPVATIEISDSALEDGVRPTRLTYDARLTDGERAVTIVPAAALSRALLNAATDDPGITWFSPADAVDVVLGDCAGDVLLGDGRTLSAPLCVAADGRTSKLRDAAGIKTIGWDYDQTGLVTTVAFSAPHDAVAIQHFLPGGPFAILPLKGDRACITWSADRAEAHRVMALDDEAFAAELDQRIAGRFGDVRLDGPRQSWPLDFKVPRELVARRFALIGDAAHGVHPIAGQGVNLAFRDAAALSECIVDALRIGFDAGHAPALERYSRWRRFDSVMSATLYDSLNRVFSVDNAVFRATRGAGLGLFDQFPEAKRVILAEAAGQTGELPKLMRGAAI
ncbi:MAG: FAD-dependent monooxygenase [Hyphomicrobium sp.]